MPRSGLDPAHVSHFGYPRAQMSADPFDHVGRGHLAVRTVAFDSQYGRSTFRVEADELHGRFLDVQKRPKVQQRATNPFVDVISTRSSRKDHANASLTDGIVPFDT